MSAFTVRYRPIPTDDVRRTLEEFARRNGAQVSWSTAQAYNRSYALVEGAGSPMAATAEPAATIFDSPIIALAIRPNVAEALPALEHALGGSGRPAGMRGFEISGDAAILEWNHDVTPASTVLALVDLELDRFHAARVTEILTPLPLAWWTSIAAQGLQAPEIAPDRVLESLIEEHRVVP